MQPESRAHGELYNRRLLWSDLCQLHRGHWFSADTTSLLECGMEMTSLSWLVSDPGLGQQEERPIRQILYLGDLLETCHFQAFWQALDENMDLLEGITGFEDSVRKFICHVVGITYQHIDRWLLAEMLGDLTDNQLKVWMSKYGWSADESGQIFICSQEESIKPKNIVEKIDFDSVSSIMASSQ
uniref:eukaryotic translation initiation factor 3 subunit K isoform X2 n=1 Tax=Ictidomys tridecemlineatus TaxID=43179 RepID=UPI001A9E1FBD|nr:eukaryotic translation initiation factor 3 subunit K isoform X2 [Ictidomys tridecemlineatus]